MNKLKYILAIIIIGSIAAFGVYKFAMNPVPDTSGLKAVQSTNFSNINKLILANDTVALKSFYNKVVSLSGTISTIANEDSLVTIVLGDTGSNNSIVCQVDNRHLGDFASLAPSAEIKIKGVCTGFQTDDMGLGGSMELKNCVLDK